MLRETPGRAGRCLLALSAIWIADAVGEPARAQSGELPAGGAWVSLFDGQSLDGWTALPGGQWEVQEGVIRGTSAASEPRHGLLLSNDTFRDFTVRVVYRANRGNSGLYFRAERVDGAVSVHGFQAEIDAQRDAGGLYETGGRAWVVQPAAELVQQCFRPGEWNEMIVSARGGDVVVHVNGTKTAELKDDPGRRAGHFGLQLHGGQEMDVEFRSVELRVPDSLPAGEAMEADGAASRSLVAAGAQVVQLAGGFRFTEGPAMGPDGKLYFSDIPNERILAWDPASAAVATFREDSGKANGLMFDPAGALYACEGGRRRVTRQLGGELSVVADSYGGKRLNSPNDLVLDREGGVFFTDPSYGNRNDLELDQEAVYYQPRQGALVRVIDDLVRPNGLILSPDQSVLYVADNGAKSIWAYDHQPGGKLSNPRKFADMDRHAQGGGDGMTVDKQGHVYCAGQGRIWIWDSQGRLRERIDVPEAPANCTFGGTDGKTLFITARTGLYSIRMK